MQIELRIVNSQAEWFIPFCDVPAQVHNMLHQDSEESPGSAGKDDAKPGDYHIHPLMWRRSFSVDIFNMSRIADIGSKKISGQSIAEFAFWYADRFGTGRPDFLSVGLLEYGIGRVPDSGYVIKKDLGDYLLETASALEQSIFRFDRPRNHIIPMEVEHLTPEPPRRIEVPPPVLFMIRNNMLELYDTRDQKTHSLIDFYGLYAAIDRWYIDNITGGKPQPVGTLPFIPPGAMVPIFEGIGITSASARLLYQNLLVEANLLERKGDVETPQGYRPTNNGASAYNSIRRRI
jgi:hypothetical protein